VVVTADADEVAGINSRGELAEAEARWQRRRARAMADGATLVAPETVWFAWDTAIGRDDDRTERVVRPRRDGGRQGGDPWLQPSRRRDRG
jgi:bifunctional N-acetylglucosamine-1-phosphate-uridyltransferase/glucosamine-1-phosphate-acetyltransferase GlmU-like protein